MLLAAFIFAFLITKTITDARTDRALADKGIVSPRLQAKYGTAAKEKTTQYGMVGYLADAWSDNWRQRTDIRRAARVAADTAEPAAAGVGRVRFRDRLAAAKDAVIRFGETATPVVRKLVDPVPDRRAEPVPTAELVVEPTPDPVVEVAGPRCPDCGKPLHPTATGWDHPDGPNCPDTGTPYRVPTAAPGSELDDQLAAARKLQAEVERVARAPRCPQHGATLFDGRCSICDDPDDLPCRRCHRPIRDHIKVPVSGHPDGADFACPRGRSKRQPPCGWCGQPAPHFHEQAYAAICDLCADRMRGSAATADNPRPCARCGTRTTTTHYASMLPACPTCVGLINRERGRVEPYHTAAKDTRISAYDPNTTEGTEDPMTAPTGEAVNYETTVAELEAIEREQLKHVDQADACEKAIGDAKAAIDGMQESYKTTAAAAQGINEHLAAMNLDGETLAQVGTIGDAMPPNKVSEMYDHLELIEAEARQQKLNAETALAATRAALGRVIAEYGELHAGVAEKLGGDPSFVGSGAPAAG